MSDSDDEDCGRQPVPRVIQARRISPEAIFKREVEQIAEELLEAQLRDPADDEHYAERRTVSSDGSVMVMRLTVTRLRGGLQ